MRRRLIVGRLPPESQFQVQAISIAILPNLCVQHIYACTYEYSANPVHSCACISRFINKLVSDFTVPAEDESIWVSRTRGFTKRLKLGKIYFLCLLARLNITLSYTLYRRHKLPKEPPYIPILEYPVTFSRSRYLGKLRDLSYTSLRPIFNQIRDNLTIFSLCVTWILPSTHRGSSTQLITMRYVSFKHLQIHSLSIPSY